MISALLQYQFLQNAVLAGLLASVVCGLIGVIIVEKKLVMMSGGIAHTSFGGIGLGYYINIEPIWGAFFISALAAVGISFFRRRQSTDTDAIIGLFWSIGMAMGILFIAFTPGYPPAMDSYLFGNILTVRRVDLMLITALTLVVFFVVISLFSYWKAFLFDEQFAQLRGVKVAFLEYLLYLLIAMAVVVLIRVVGIILILALLTAPPVIAAKMVSGLANRMLCAMLLGAFFCLFGLWLSYEMGIATGAAIVLLAGIVYIFASILERIWQKKYVHKRSQENSTQT